MRTSLKGYTVAIFLVLLLFSPLVLATVKFTNPQSIQQDRQYEKTPEFRKHPIQPDNFPSLVKPIGSDKYTVVYSNFKYRDEALSNIDSRFVSYIFKYMPGFTIDGLPYAKLPKNGLKSISETIPIQKASQQEQYTDLGSKIDFGWTLNQTAQMIGIDILKKEYGLTGQGVKVAIIDTGINNQLESFQGRIDVDVVTALKERGTIDEDGHGTHVTGILGGNGKYFIDGQWVQTDSPGMAPGVQIESIRVLDENGRGEDAWVLEAIEMAINKSVDIISLSLSTTIYQGENDPMQEIINEAYRRGIIVVAASGNTGPIGSAIGIPASLENVISVGATYSRDIVNQEVWSFSGVGPSTFGYPGPDILAPGVQINSIGKDDGAPSVLSGTSMATPHVSGGIALLKEAFPTATFDQVREALLASARLTLSSGIVDPVEAQGRGIVQFNVAYEILSEIINDASATNMPIQPMLIQDLNYIYHHRIAGTTKSFDFFLQSSRNTTILPQLDGEPIGVDISMPNEINITVGMNKFTFNFTITAERTGINFAKMYFVENGTNQMLRYANITFVSETSFKQSRILFDVSHDQDTPSGYFGGHTPDGQFSQLRRILEAQGHRVSTTNGLNISESMLSEFDMLIIANPDKAYSAREIEAIQNFMERDGKAVLIIVGGGFLDSEGHDTFAAANYASLNAITVNSGISIPNDPVTPNSVSPCSYDSNYDERISVCYDDARILSNQPVFSESLFIANYGPELSINPKDGVSSFSAAQVIDNIVIAGAEFSSKGRLLVFSSPLLFDNVGLLYDYFENGDALANRDLVFEAVDWLLEPRSINMNYKINNVPVEKSVTVNMYENIQITFSPVDKDGNPIILGDNPTVYVRVFDFELGFGFGALNATLIDVNANIYAINYNFESNQVFDIFIPISVPGSIPTNGHLSLYAILKNFELQNSFRKVATFMLVAFIASWIFWVKNEGGIELKRKQEEDKKHENT